MSQVEDVVPLDKIGDEAFGNVGVVAPPYLRFRQRLGEAGGDAVLDLLDECVEGPVDGNGRYRHAERMVLNVNGGISCFSVENVGFREGKKDRCDRGRKIKVVCLTSEATQKPLRSVAEEDRSKEALASQVAGQRKAVNGGEW